MKWNHTQFVFGSSILLENRHCTVSRAERFASTGCTRSADQGRIANLTDPAISAALE